MSIRQPWMIPPNLTRAVVLALVAIGLLAQSPSVSAAPPPPSDGIVVEFDGAELDLSEDWGDAMACAFDGVTARCFHSESEMDRALAITTTVTRPMRTIATTSSSCSSALRLYTGTYQQGTVLLVAARQTPVDLSLVGFNNVTSSYRVGACTSTLYAGFLTSIYPGNTAAYVQANVMLSGWNNTISSVYLL